jgi:ATP-dependent RNA helicase DeaD
MLDMGFREELEAILGLVPSERRTHLVSATFSGEVLAVARRVQKESVHLEGSPLGSANTDIEHVAHVVPERHRYDALVNLLLLHQGGQEPEAPGRVLVFTRTRRDTAEVADRLGREGFKAEPLSGDLAQASRTRTLEAFRHGRIGIIVATDVAARGLDIDGVSLVVHFDPPGDADALTHRSGRTGRAGQKGTSVLLLPPQSRRRMERLLHDARISPTFAPVPSADKINKAYTKAGRRKIFAALEQAQSEDALSYAAKLLAEHPADKVIAALLGMTDQKPPCPPRDVSFHLSADVPRPRHQGNKPYPPKGYPGTGAYSGDGSGPGRPYANKAGRPGPRLGQPRPYPRDGARGPGPADHERGGYPARGERPAGPGPERNLAGPSGPRSGGRGKPPPFGGKARKPGLGRP